MKASSLYRNDGSGLFVDEEVSSGIRQMTLQTLTFSCFFFDYDLDGSPRHLCRQRPRFRRH